MLLVVNGPSGAGKTTIRARVAAMLGCESVEIRTLRPDKPVRTTADRQAIGKRVVAQAVELAAYGRHLLFCGDPFPLGEVLACPSATEVDIAVCHLDIAEHEQVRRLRQRGEPEDSLVHHVAFATSMRKHARDPRSAPHVITENGWERMAWDRWLGRDDLVGIWHCDVIDATALAPDQVVAAVTDWGRRAIAGDTSCSVDTGITDGPRLRALARPGEPSLDPMTDSTSAPFGRRSARAILIDESGRILLIKRTKPGQVPYWTTPGGGVEEVDLTIEAALHRELTEELGAKAFGATEVFLHSSPTEAGLSVQHFFLARLACLDAEARNGPELNDPSRGEYVLDRVDLDGLEDVDLKPSALKRFIMANRGALLAEVARLA